MKTSALLFILSLFAMAHSASMAWAAIPVCRLALSIGMDVSPSISFPEFRQQREGLASALRQPDVREAFLGGDPVMLHIFEWSDRAVTLIDWTPIASGADLDRIAGIMLGAPRSRVGGNTQIGTAMLYGGAALVDAPCIEKVLDISGDDPVNGGPAPELVRENEHVMWIEVNGLVIGPRATVDYYEQFVINGPRAFVEHALSFADFSEAMKRKLIRETITLSMLED